MLRVQRVRLYSKHPRSDFDLVAPELKAARHSRGAQGYVRDTPGVESAPVQ